MRLTILAVSGKKSGWERDGFDAYAKRLPREYRLEQIALPLDKRARAQSQQLAIEKESEQLLQRVPANALTVALDERGKQWQSREFAQRLAH